MTTSKLSIHNTTSLSIWLKYLYTIPVLYSYCKKLYIYILNYLFVNMLGAYLYDRSICTTCQFLFHLTKLSVQPAGSLFIRLNYLFNKSASHLYVYSDYNMLVPYGDYDMLVSYTLVWLKLLYLYDSGICTAAVSLLVGSAQQKSEKATDDFHYEKFKKQLRRYWLPVHNIIFCWINALWMETGSWARAGTPGEQLGIIAPVSCPFFYRFRCLFLQN